jgi:hypothetical protein
LNRYRWLTLFFGPVPIVLGSMGLADWLRSPAAPPLTKNHVVLRVPNTAPGELLPPPAMNNSSPEMRAAPSHRTATIEAGKLNAACQEAADRLSEQLGPGCGVIVRTPFLIGGDLEEVELARYYDRTIGPAARAMAQAYFDTPPDKPITVLLFSGEQSYNRYAQQLYGDEGISVYGYYKPHLRTLVMNIGTGSGTLVHELTHALIAFDFPRVPAWFNEGLASLHEQCQIKPDETGIDGLVNWRLQSLQKALASGKLRTLASLIGDNDFRGNGESLNYAQARYFCLYLQEHDLLVTFYHRFRAGHARDPLGVQTAASLFPDRSWETLDADFREWAAGLKQ